jgi:hypothetical protein
LPPGYPPAPAGYSGYAPASPPTNGMAITSLVLGIVAFPGICFYGIPAVALGITAVILGRISLSRIRAAGGAMGGRGLAQAGWICGLVAAILGAIYVLFVLVFLIFGLSGGFGSFTISSPTPSG